MENMAAACAAASICVKRMECITENTNGRIGKKKERKKNDTGWVCTVNIEKKPIVNM
jgi:hypothetical protein